MIKGLFAWGKFLGIFYASGEILGKFWNIAGKFFWRELGTLVCAVGEKQRCGHYPLNANLTESKFRLFIL